MARKIDISLISGNGGSSGQLLGANTGNVSFLSIYTSNVIETGNTTSGNVYFSNARAIGALIAGDNITIAANGRISATASGGGSVTSANLTTANVVELAGNLYYTNARVASNVITLLPTLAGDNITIAANGRISANLAGASVSSVTGNLNVTGNVIANGFVSASASAGLITSSGNITMTAAGAVNLNSTNVIATGNVIANTFISTGAGSGLLSSTGNVTISATGIVTISGSNIIVNGPLTANSYSGITTANVTETSSGLYYTNARVYSNIIALLPQLAGNNIIIAANGQISANLAAAGGGAASSVLATGVIGLNTANVSESASNLYYTNARVASNVLALMPSLAGNNIIIAANGQISANLSAVSVSVNSVSGNLNVTGNVIANGFVSASASAGLITSSGNITMTAAGAVNINSTNVFASGNIVANTFISTGAGAASLASTGNVSITGVGNITLNSGNVIASGNVVASKFFGDGSSLTGISASSFSGNTNGITEGTTNLYYTNARVYSNVISLLNAKANVVDLTTANVLETSSGLYYTNARVQSNTLALLPTLAGSGINIAANGQISSAWQNTSTASNVTFAALNVTGPVNFYGNVTTYSSNNLSVSDNMIYLNNGSQSSNPDLGFAGNYNDGSYKHTGFFRDASDAGTWKVFENYTPEPDANIFIDTTHATFRLANLAATTFIGNVTGIVSSISNFSTSNLAEGSNLYYTNARVLSNITAYLAANPQGGYANANVAAYLATYTGNISAGNVLANSFVSPTATSATLTSTGNLNITAGGTINLTTANVLASGNIIANNFVSAGNGSGEITSTSNLLLSATGNLNLTSSNVYVNGNLVLRGGLSGVTTSNIAEGTNLYYTNARVYSNIIALLPQLAGNNIIIAANGQISANLAAAGGGAASSVLATGVIGLNTANVSESASNLYYTNARVLSNVTAYLAANPQGGSYANANVAAYLAAYTGNLTAGNVIANSFVSPTATSATLTSTGNLNITASGTVNLTTANVLASGNIIANNFISAGNGSGEVTSTSNLLLNGTGNLNLSGGNIYVNSPITFRGTVTGIASATVTQANLTTGNVAELASSGNLYYTNARVYSNVIAALPTYTGNIAGGNLILTGGIVDTTGVLTIATTTNANIEINAFGTGRIVLDGMAWPLTDGANGYSLQTNGTGNLYWGAQSSPFGNANVAAYLVTNPQAGSFGNANVAAYLVTNPQAGNYANANVAAYLATYTGNVSAGNVISNVFVSPSATSGTLNSTGNLNIIAQNNTINLTASNVLASGNVIANTFIATGSGSAELSTGSNLLLSATGNLNLTGGNIYVNSPITFRGTVTGISSASVTQANLTTGNVAELASSGNLYYTNARVYSNVISILTSYAPTANLTTANVNEVASSGNLYYTNARVYSNVISILTSYAPTANLTTANVNEVASSGNLYYTNARVVSNVIAYLAANPQGGSFSNANVAAYLVTYTGNVSAGNVIANTILSPTATSGTMLSTGNLNITAQNNTINLTASNILASGNVIANTFIATGSGSAELSTGSNLLLSATGNLNLVSGNVYANGTKVGYLNVPQSGTDKTSSYTLVTTDVGKFISVGTGGGIVIPNATFGIGDAVSIFNNTASTIYITCSITTAYISGTNTGKSNVSLATRGVASILFINGTLCVLTGSVS